MPKISAEPEAESRPQISSPSPELELGYGVGSGPAGVACAKVLLDAGRRVRMLDAGLTLEPDRTGLVEKLKIAEPGRSFHSGGSFPMSKEPRGFQTDLLGRLPGWKRIYAVDATVFPSIPATTITFSAMANAHRIGWEAARHEPGS